MWDDYVKEMEALGKKVKACTGGFDGKGFKFNEQEESVSDERKKIQKLAFDLHVDSDEEDADLDLDVQIEDLFKSKRSIKDKQEQALLAQMQINQLPLNQIVPSSIKIDKSDTGKLIANALGNVQASIANKLKMAKEMADKVSANRSYSNKNILVILYMTVII
jgi:hypothetical protein